MAKGNKNQKKGSPQKPPQIKKPAEETTPVETVVNKTTPATEEPAGNEVLNVAKGKSKLSLDGRVKLLDLAQRHFIDQQDEELKYPREMRIGMNKLIGVGIVATIADAAINGDDTFSHTITSASYPMLVQIAKESGVKLPEIKQLEAKTPKEEREKGNVTITADGVKVSEETAKELKKEHELKNSEIETDPTKITSEEDLKKALEYIILKGEHKVAKTLTSVVDFMREYRIKNEAEKAENAAEAKLKFDDRNMFEWLDDIFSYVEPTFLYKGIGRGIIETAKLTKNPIRAFWILRNALTNKEGVVVWDDVSIAYAIQAIVKWYLGNENAKLDEQLANTDAKNKTEIESIKNKMKENDEIFGYFFDPDHTSVQNFGENFAKAEKETVKDFDHIVDMYYPEVQKKNYLEYKNLFENVTNLFGYIFNMFCNPAARQATYIISNVVDLEKYSEEELVEIKKNAMKKHAEDSPKN